MLFLDTSTIVIFRMVYSVYGFINQNDASRIHRNARTILQQKNIKT